MEGKRHKALVPKWIMAVKFQAGGPSEQERFRSRRSLNAHLFVIRQAEFVERNVTPKRVGQSGVALDPG